MLAAGAPIDELNALRKHTCALAGGRLAIASTARDIRVLAVSDVPGDRLDWIGSGPCAADPSRFEDVLDSLLRRDLIARVTPALRRALERGARGELPESAKPGQRKLERVRHTIVSSNAVARRAALEAGRALGLRTVDLGECLTGEARAAAVRLIALGEATARGAPTLFVGGGETVVTVRGPGRGGRNQELALAAAIELERRPQSGIEILAAATDGGDGPTDAAGAWVDRETCARAARLGADAVASLEANDSYRFFGVEGGRLHTGPTHTNVMDLVLIGRDLRSNA
jgi:hydroxypyruvate reductase